MRPSERVTYKGYEVCLFPMNTAICSRGRHGAGYDSDWYYGINTPVYASFSGRVTFFRESDNTIYFASNEPVWTPKGLRYVTISLTHSDNISPYPWRVGQEFTQGDLLYHTGVKSDVVVTGDHLHLDQAEGTINDFNTFIANAKPTLDIFYLSGTEQDINSYNLTEDHKPFKIWTSTRTKIWLYKSLIERRRLWS